MAPPPSGSDRKAGGGMKGLQFTAELGPRSDYTLSEFERRTGKAVTGSSVWRNPRVRLADVKEPPLPAKDVRIRPRACGVCGSDVHFYETDEQGYIRYPGLTKFPVVIGHEFSGEIVEVGKEVRDLRPGDLVTVEEMIWCGECVPCRNGWPNQCLNLEEIGFTIDGAMAEQRVGGAEYCWPITALAEVYGGGEAGAGAGAALAVEGAGARARPVPEMEQSLAIGGKVVIIGRAAERAPMYLEHLQTRAAQVYGAQGHSGYGTFQNVIRLMASRRIDLRPVITSRFPLSEAVAAIERATKRQDGKVLVKG